MTRPQIEKFTNAFGQTRYRINFGPSIFRPGQDNRSIKVWETHSGARKAIPRFGRQG